MAKSHPHTPQQYAKAHAAIEEIPQKEKYITYSALNASTNKSQKEFFLADTGENTRVACDSSLLHDIQPITPVNINGIAGVNGQVIASFGGTASVDGKTTDSQSSIIKVKNVLLAPKAGVNLLAVSVMKRHRARFSGNDQHIEIVNPSKNYVIKRVSKFRDKILKPTLIVPNTGDSHLRRKAMTNQLW